MARRGLHGQAITLLDEGGGARFVDMQVELREWDGKTSILEVGGRWDRQLGEWSDDDAAEKVIWKVQPSQYEAAYWFADWMRAYALGERVPGFEDVYVLLFEGGRGAGKSDFGVKAAAMFAVAFSRRVVWDIAPVKEETAELQRVMDDVLDEGWYRWLKSEQIYRLWNGSEIWLMSGYNAASLKRGRVDFWLMNEGQRFSKRAYNMARPRLGDTSGLGVIAANPPDEPKGRWIMDFHDMAQAGGLPDVKLFEFDNQKNPTLDWRSMEVLKEGLGEDDYRREILGEFIPIGDIVLYAWSPSLHHGNVRPLPDVGDVTREFTRRHLGREFDDIVGTDFQLSPHMAAVPTRMFGDVNDPLTWFKDEVVVEGTEDDLIDLLEAKGYDPNRTAVIADASGEWQDAERTKGRGSFDIFRRRGWKFIYTPDARMKKNPQIIERVQAANARICNAEKVRRVFSVPENQQLNRALKMWENRNGVPYRRSPFAHLCDAATYVIWRFFPRKYRGKGFEFERVKRTTTALEDDLSGF